MLHTLPDGAQHYVVLLENVSFYDSFNFRFAQPDALKKIAEKVLKSLPLKLASPSHVLKFSLVYLHIFKRNVKQTKKIVKKILKMTKQSEISR